MIKEKEVFYSYILLVKDPASGATVHVNLVAKNEESARKLFGGRVIKVLEAKQKVD